MWKFFYLVNNFYLCVLKQNKMSQSNEFLSIYLTSRTHSTNVGYVVGVSLYHVLITGEGRHEERKQKIMKRNYVNVGTSDAATTTMKNMSEVIAKKLEHAKLTPLNDETKKVKIILTKNIQFSFDMTNKDALIEFFNGIYEDIDQIRKYSNPLKAAEYKIHDEEYLNYVVVFKEKHGDRYFVVNSPDALYRASLEVLKERYNNEWYNWMKDHKPYEGTNTVRPTYTLAEVNALPESMSNEKEKMTKEINKWAKEDKEAAEIRETFTSIEKAISEKDGQAAYSILSELKDGEYEGFQVIETQKV